MDEPIYPLDTLALIFGDDPDSPTADVNSLYHACVNLSLDFEKGRLDADYLAGVGLLLAGNPWREDAAWRRQCAAWRKDRAPAEAEIWWWPERW